MKRNKTVPPICNSKPLPISSAPNAEEVLRELFELVEEYGPVWYTEEHHRRAGAALQHAQPRAIRISER